jgi:hypothetical protein
VPISGYTLISPFIKVQRRLILSLFEPIEPLNDYAADLLGPRMRSPDRIIIINMFIPSTMSARSLRSVCARGSYAILAKVGQRLGDRNLLSRALLSTHSSSKEG